MSSIHEYRDLGSLLTSLSAKFSQAIELEPANHVLYSNRSGAYASTKDFQSALDDAEKTIEIKPEWAKGWGRKGSALHGIGMLGMVPRDSLYALIVIYE